MSFQVTGGSRREGNSFGGGKMRENLRKSTRKRKKRES